MPVRVRWYSEDRDIALYTIRGNWTLQEVIDVTMVFDSDRYPPPMYYIIDMRGAGALPDGTLAAREVVFEYFNQPEAMNVIVGGNRLMEWIVRLMQRLGLASEFIFVDSMQAAEDWIRQHQQQKVS